MGKHAISNMISQGMEAMLSCPKIGSVIGIPVLRSPGAIDHLKNGGARAAITR